MVFTCTYTVLLYILHLELFGTVTVLFLIAVGQWRHHTNHPGLASLYKLLQGLPLQVSSIKDKDPVTATQGNCLKSLLQEGLLSEVVTET